MQANWVIRSYLKVYKQIGNISGKNFESQMRVQWILNSKYFILFVLPLERF